MLRLTMPSPPLTFHSHQGGAAVHVEQPAGMADGLRQAGTWLRGGFGSAAQALVVAPVRSMQGGESLRSAVARALKAAPAAAIAPATAAAAAVRCTLLGARNALDPERRD
jgi:autophagy-related protein 2